MRKGVLASEKQLAELQALLHNQKTEDGPILEMRTFYPGEGCTNVSLVNFHYVFFTLGFPVQTCGNVRWRRKNNLQNCKHSYNQKTKDDPILEMRIHQEEDCTNVSLADFHYSQSHELRLPWNKIIALDFFGLRGVEHGKLHILHWAKLRLRALGKPRP